MLWCVVFQEEIAKQRLGEADKKGPAISTPPFKFIQMHVVREYLDKEFRDVPFLFTYDLEQVSFRYFVVNKTPLQTRVIVAYIPSHIPQGKLDKECGDVPLLFAYDLEQARNRNV